MIVSAAWVPDDDPSRDWDVAAALATEWVDARCQSEAAGGVLVTNHLDHLGVPALDAFERRHARTSRRAGRRRVGSGAGPVLSYVPQPDDLEFAMALARGSSLAVVETIAFPILGWASWLEAWDLTRDKQTPPLIAPLRDAVERLKAYGNNGFGDTFGKTQAGSILRQVSHIEGAQDLLPGAVLAAGVSARGVGNLQRLIAKAH